MEYINLTKCCYSQWLLLGFELSVLWSERLPMTINYALGGIPMKAVMAYCKALSLHLLQRNKKNYTTFS